jgi:hypothetical protein
LPIPIYKKIISQLLFFDQYTKKMLIGLLIVGLIAVFAWTQYLSPEAIARRAAEAALAKKLLEESRYADGVRRDVNPKQPPGKKRFETGTEWDDTILDLYPDENYRGWDSNDYNERTGTYADNCAFTPLHVAEEGSAVRAPIFMKQRNGKKNWIYNSFRCEQGTIMYLFGKNPQGNGRAFTSAFLIGGYNVRSIPDMLRLYPEITQGNTGLMLDGWEHWDIDFHIAVIDVRGFYSKQALKNFQCMNQAAGSNNENPLTWPDGSPVEDLSRDDKKTWGRWLFEDDCHTKVIGPDGKQKYAIGGGWNYSCDKAKDFCSWPSVIGRKSLLPEDHLPENNRGWAPEEEGADETAGSDETA